METETLEITAPQSALADEIRAAHERASGQVNGAKVAIEDAINASLNCAALVETARAEWGGMFPDLWRELVGLSPLDAKRYISLHSTAQRCLDKRQLILTGIIEQPEQGEQEQRPPADPFAWCRWVPKIKDSFTKEQVERMTSDQKAVARRTLAPLVEIYEELGK